MKKFKFSVIIPVYNVEDYLEETIESVVNQTIGFEDNIQIVLINDGSPDNSEKICLKYKELYPNNIIYYQQKNSGVSVVRNKGIELATGTFSTMLDSDDKWSKNSFECVWDNYLSHKDISLFSCKMVFFDKKKGNHPLNYKYEKDIVVDIFKDYEYPQLSSSSIFIKTDILKKYKYEPSIKFSEDNRLINEIIFDEQKMMMLKEPIYYYRRRSTGTSAIQTSSMKDDWYFITPIKVYKYLFDLSKKKFGRVIEYIQNLVAYEIVWRIEMNKNYEITKTNKKKYADSLMDLIKDIDDDILINHRFLGFPSYAYLLNKKHKTEEYNKLVFHGKTIKIKNSFLSKKKLGIVIIDQIYLRDDKLIAYGKLDTRFISKKDFNIKLNDEKIKIDYYELTNDSNVETFDGGTLHDYIGFNFEVKIIDTWKLCFYSNDDYLIARFKKSAIFTEFLYRSYHHVDKKTLVRKNEYLYLEKRNIFKSFYYEIRNELNLLKRKRFKSLLARLYIKLGSFISYDINTIPEKNEVLNLSTINTINNIWGALSKGKGTNHTFTKIYYYLCRLNDIDCKLITINNFGYQKNIIKEEDTEIITDITNDLPYIQSGYQTRFFGTYNDDINLDRVIGYIEEYSEKRIEKIIKTINNEFKNYLVDILEYGLTKYKADYANNTGMFLLWNSYTKSQVQLKRCVNPGDINPGTFYGTEGDVYIFASIKKDLVEGLEHLNYKDKFLESNLFQWECKASISDRDLNLLNTSKCAYLFIRKMESENGITLPFTYVGIGHLDNPRQSQNEESKRTFIFDIHMEEELPDYLQYDFGLTN